MDFVVKHKGRGRCYAQVILASPGPTIPPVLFSKSCFQFVSNCIVIVMTIGNLPIASHDLLFSHIRNNFAHCDFKVGGGIYRRRGRTDFPTATIPTHSWKVRNFNKQKLRNLAQVFVAEYFCQPKNFHFHLCNASGPGPFLGPALFHIRQFALFPARLSRSPSV